MGGGRWTFAWSDVTSWLFTQAEARFGPRDPRFLFTGVAFADIPAPVVYHPFDHPRHVAVCLTQAAATAPALAYFQLAQHVVHLLGPSETPGPPNVLEQGLATAFALEVNTLAALGCGVDEPALIAALRAALELIGLHPTAVRRLRQQEPDLRRLTPSRLLEAAPRLEPGLAARLCEPWRP